MQVEIVTPVGVKYSGEAKGVIVPGVLGDMGILPGHQPILAALRTGACFVDLGQHDPIALVVDGGYVHVTDGRKVTLTTELCETWQEIDDAAVRSQLEQANHALGQAREAISTLAWQSKKHDVDLATTRLRVLASKP
jgi:F-type H+-transporting ATPase subunit epsilon